MTNSTRFLEAAIQDFYPEDVSHCYGCGKLNEHGHQIKTYWTDAHRTETIAHFTPKPYHTAIPGFVYGGLIASLIDCHGTGTAAAVAYREANNQPWDQAPAHRFVTASLHVDYHKPTPLTELELRGRAVEIKGRKVVVEIELSADGVVTATGRLVGIEISESFGKAG